jgi:hypothetical protein
MQSNIQNFSVTRAGMSGTANQLVINNTAVYCTADMGCAWHWMLNNVSTSNGVTTTTLLDLGDNAFTQAQYDGWTGSQTDASYILSCVAANLGLTLTS